MEAPLRKCKDLAKVPNMLTNLLVSEHLLGMAVKGFIGLMVTTYMKPHNDKWFLELAKQDYKAFLCNLLPFYISNFVLFRLF